MSICEGSFKSGKKCTYKKKIGNFCKIHGKGKSEEKERKIEEIEKVTIQSLTLERDLIAKLLPAYMNYTDITIKIIEKIELLNCKIDSMKFKNIIKNEECEICLTDKQNFVQLICGHYFCIDCVYKSIESTNNRCPKCKRNVETSEGEKESKQK
jgi:hypothetical protein